MILSTDQFNALYGDTSGISSDAINVAISAAQSTVEGYCDRSFAAADYYSWIDGTGVDILYLPAWPLIQLFRVGAGACEKAQLSCNAANVQWQSVALSDARQLALTRYAAADGRQSDKITPSSLSASLTTFAAEVSSGSFGRWTLDVVEEDVVGCLKPMVTTDDSPHSLYGPADYLYNVETYGNKGLKRSFCWPRGESNIYVEYRAGYETGAVPDAIVQAVFTMAKAIIDGEQSIGGLKREKIGDAEQEYFEVKDVLTSEIIQMIQPYRRLTL